MMKLNEKYRNTGIERPRKNRAVLYSAEIGIANVVFLLILFALVAGVAGQQETSSDQTALVFTHATVIDATGAPAKVDMSVIIRGDRIEALEKSDSLVVPSNATVVDAKGKFLIPGLWDMHAHPNSGKSYLALFIANGVTGLRAMHCRERFQEWHKEVLAGDLIGPRMVIGSFRVGAMPEDLHDLRNAEEGRRHVRDLKKQGWAFLKLLNYILPDVYFAIADEANKQGIPFAGHVPNSVTVAEASDAGQRSIEHILTDIIPACSTSDECKLKTELRAALSARSPDSIRILSDSSYSERKALELFAIFVKNKTWVCPTLTVPHELLSLDEDDLGQDPRLKYIPPSRSERWRNHLLTALVTGEGRTDVEKLSRMQLKIVDDMKLAGVGLLAGTDTGMPYCFPGFGLHDELEFLVRAGLSPMEALRTATYNPAKYFGQLDSMGTIGQGKIADMVLLEANPLENISNTQKIAGVVFGGRFFDKTGLQKMLAQVEAERLHEAAAGGDIEDVKVLISEGADVNARDRQGLTPALIALDSCELAVVDLLVEKGADITTPHLAAYTGDLRGIKSLLVEKDGPMDSLEGLTLLHAAAGGGHMNVVEYLIAKGFEATATTEDNKTTPLHLAAASGHEEVAELLIDKGANVNAKDGRGCAPLHLAAQYGDIEVAQVLLVEGADPNQENGNGGTPLHVVAWNGYRAIAELLIEAGAEVEKNNTWGRTPLHYATVVGHKDVAGLLIARGANINARDDEQSTPLHFAAIRGHKDVLELLLAKDADLNAKNQRGKSPLSMANAKGHKELVELLRRHGAKE
ncbi:MAG: ankyrin repeat domain-containing protein [Planctomycetota bacterium]